MSQQILQANLRKILAKLYPDNASIRQIIDDSGIDLSRIDPNSAPVNNWHNILTYVNNTNQVVALLDVAENDYKTNEELRNTCASYRRAIGQPSRHSGQGPVSQGSLFSDQRYKPLDPILDDEEEWSETNDKGKVMVDSLPKKNITEASHTKKGKRVAQAIAKYQLTNSVWSGEIYDGNHFLGEYGLNISPSNAWEISIENTEHASVIEIWIESAENCQNPELNKLLLATDQPTKEFVKNRYSVMDKFDVIVAQHGYKDSLTANKLTLDYEIVDPSIINVHPSQEPLSKFSSVFLSITVKFSVWYQA